MEWIREEFLRLKGKSVFLNYFLSYLIILGLSVFISIVVYFYSFRVINVQSTKMSQAMLETLCVEVDGRIGEIHKLIGNIMLDSDVQKAVAVKNAFSIMDREMLYEIQMNFLAKSASTNFLHDIFIYFNNTNTILSLNGHMSGELFYDLYYRDGSMKYEEFLDFMKEPWYWNVRSVINHTGEHQLFFLQTAMLLNRADASATIGVAVKAETLNSWLENMKWDDSLEIFVMDENGFLSGSEVIKEIAHEITYQDLLDSKKIELNGHSYQVSVISSKETDWYYVALTPIKMFEKSAHKIQMVTILGVFAAVSTGILLSYLLSRINYNPLKNMLELVKRHQPEDKEWRGGGNEYQYLIEQINQFFKIHKEVQKKATDSEKILKSQYLYRLVTQAYDSTKEEDANKILTSLKSVWNIVLLVSIMPNGNAISEYELESGISKFIVINIFEELIREHYEVEHADMGDTIAFIINMPKEGHEMREQIEAVIDNMQHWLNDKFKLKAVVFAGDFRKNLEGVYPSYLNAREAYEYQDMMGEQYMLWYEDIKDHHAAYEYSMEMEQKILNAIKIGEDCAAFSLIKEVLTENFGKKAMNLSMKRCLLFDLLGTVLKGANQSGIELAEEELEQKFLPQLSITEIQQNFEMILASICGNIRKRESESRNDRQFGTRVIIYVKENYQDPDLNISQTALHFNITPSYLSAMFKEQTGLSLLEYINNVRIERAKELLNGSYSVAEIATMTGFRNSGALIRVFKKVTGITPGQMKKLNGGL